MNGFLQVYTGNGKGKTTAAIGLAVRAAGAGLNVLFAQFVKGAHYSEITALERFGDRITVRQYGRECFIVSQADAADIEAARQGLAQVGGYLQDPAFNVVILDEASIALHYGLFSVNDLLGAIGRRHPACEVVVTGRYAPPQLCDAADLVTEMKEVRHYFTAGVEARTGIER